MPTELKLQDYYRVVLSDEKCITRFHDEVNGDPSASCTPWENGRRSVSFRMALNVPAMIKKIIGSDSLKVTEMCSLTWKGDHCFELVSEPCLDFPAANKFTTSGTTVVSDTPAGCQVDCTMKCSAALPWPMQGAVEGVMAQEGQVTVGKYLEFAKQACEEDCNNRAAAAAVAAAASAAAESQQPAAAAAAAGAASAGVEEDWFFDAQEEEGMEPADYGEARQQQQRQQAGPLAAYEPLSADQAALRCLLQIHASCSETALLMGQVAASLQRMDDNIAEIRAAVVQARGRQPPHQQQRPLVPEVRVNGGRDQQQQERGLSAHHSWMLLGCLGLAGASVVALTVLRARQRGSFAAGGT